MEFLGLESLLMGCWFDLFSPTIKYGLVKVRGALYDVLFHGKQPDSLSTFFLKSFWALLNFSLFNTSAFYVGHQTKEQKLNQPSSEDEGWFNYYRIPKDSFDQLDHCRITMSEELYPSNPFINFALGHKKSAAALLILLFGTVAYGIAKLITRYRKGKKISKEPLQKEGNKREVTAQPALENETKQEQSPF